MAAASKLARLQQGEGGKRSTRRAEKKRELARHAISTLGRIGYARTSLRDIAEQSDVSLGVLHYYFEDKIELISFCVQMYKDEFIDDLDTAVLESATPEAAGQALVDRLVAVMRDQTSTHMLWYDISAQALFDPVFRPVVAEIEAALVGVVARVLRRFGADEADATATYMVFDGIFRHHLLRHVGGDAEALQKMRGALNKVLLGIAARAAAA